MPIILINGESVTPAEFGTYQKHGLSPTDRKPNDYLRMVARTFSSFRATASQDTVVSYINGFEIAHNALTATIVDGWVQVPTDFEMFVINKGACMIDNQLIDIYEDTTFYFKKDEFIPETKYGIVIEYDYIEQYSDNPARIRFIDYNSLHFPREEDANVVTCDYIDTSLDGIQNTVEFSGKPGLLIGTFSTNGNLDIVQSDPPIEGVDILGIDPQYLSKLYIQNYKLLFEYFGSQSRAIYSTMGMTNSNFISIDINQLDISGNAETDLRSGDMCYYDDETNLYKRSVASRQKFSQVIGLYLNERNEGNHLIFTSGVITLDANKYNLPPTHNLLTLIPGSHYYLEDACSLFDTDNQIRTIDNYVLADSSGRISPRFYPSSVRVGFATACNQIVLNIDHSSEIGAGNLLSLFGNYEEYKKEITANDIVIDMETSNEALILRNQLLEDRVSVSTIQIGSNDNTLIDGFCFDYSNINNEAFTYALYNILPRYFVDGINGQKISDIDLNIVPLTDLTDFSSSEQSDIVAHLTTWSNLKNIENLIKENIVDINLLRIAKETALSNFLVTYKEQAAIKNVAILEYDLKIGRYELGDKFDEVDAFENFELDYNNNTIIDYASEIVTLKAERDLIISTQVVENEDYFDQVYEINRLQSMESEMDIHLRGLSKLIDAMAEQNIRDTMEVIANESQISANITTRNGAANNIMNADSNKLNIFLMDDHQRVIFNYTYITDRLRKRLFLVDQLSTDLVSADLNYHTILLNPESTIIEQITALEEVNRITNFIQSNNLLITNYTEEYNRIRIYHFALPPIVQGDVDFDDGGYSNQKIGTYRYGCDDYETTYGGLATNLISSPCGPYTSPDGLIVPKNTIDNFLDVISNDGHSTGESLTMHTLDTPQHGDARIVTRLLFIPDALADANLIGYTIYDGLGIVVTEEFDVIENNISLLIDGLTDLSEYTIHNSLGDPAIGNIIINSGVSYTPVNEYSGSDIFSYTVIDESNKIATGTVNIEVTGPFTTDDTISIFMNTSDNILNILGNDGHTADGEYILIYDAIVQPSHGTISLTQGVDAANRGSITYTPDLNYVGNDYFVYRITDDVIEGGVATGAIVEGEVRIIVQ